MGGESWQHYKKKMSNRVKQLFFAPSSEYLACCLCYDLRFVIYLKLKYSVIKYPNFKASKLSLTYLALSNHRVQNFSATEHS